ncbi:MAG TPA: hypothetical protein VEI82_07895 [Myxococcota bacterium]|nr:hypothetical protein [Myxococcota bacterium]
MFRVALQLLLAAALGAAPLLARADVYRWVDDHGVTHFATSKDAIPRRYRDAAKVIQEEPAHVTNPSSSQPPARREPPPEPAQAPALRSPEAAPPQAPGPAPEPAAPEPAPGARAPEQPAAAPGAPATPQSDAAHPAAREPGLHEDPRQQEIAELEGKIERDRETLRELISTPRFDSAALASDPRVREIAERLPRLQAELAALRSESGH